jgi:dTDP-4-dehydrorhamnose 3,5-epimerase
MTMDSNTKLQARSTEIADVLLVEPKVFGDQRGWFTESFNAKDFAKATGLNVDFVQDNHSFSRHGPCGACIISLNIPKGSWCG